MRTVLAPRNATITDEIRLLFGPEIDDYQIECAVQDALDDLRGSVSPGSLAEMSMRLAVVRLDRVAHPG
jgi:hypothetical protein